MWKQNIWIHTAKTCRSTLPGFNCIKLSQNEGSQVNYPNYIKGGMFLHYFLMMIKYY